MSIQTILVFLFTVILVDNSVAFSVENNTDYGELSISLFVVIGVIATLSLILILSLCGGCTPMEVGSDQHEAAGGRSSYLESSNYTIGNANVNTKVLTSGTHIAQDPYHPDDNFVLPYPVRPQTDNTFTGYSTQQQGYQHPQHGYQTQQQGYQQQQQHGNLNQHSYQQQQSIPGANRHVTDESEPAPPSYNEVLGATGNQSHPSAPSYGW